MFYNYNLISVYKPYKATTAIKGAPLTFISFITLKVSSILLTSIYSN